jgi:23S rRNA (adenine2503-C2)-methyltransferase
MGAVNRDPRALWLDQVAASAGFSNAETMRERLALKPYRLQQLYRAGTKELASDVASVTPLPQNLRDDLQARGLSFSSVDPVRLQRSGDGQTTKGLFRLRDGAEVEAVLMQHTGGRNTVCISSQAGCAFACAFCSTGQAGFGRHLKAAEIFDQARFFARELLLAHERITNVVFMGMGEPFHNYDAVMGAVALLNDPHGFGLGARHITISTVGLADKIDRFAGESLGVNLAISLHAPNDRIREQIMPVNRRFPLRELFAACERYVAKTGRKVFFEYVMLAGVNDDDQSARELSALMRGHLYHVNLIPYNPTPDSPLRGSSDARIWEFAAILERSGVPITVRHTMGRDIAAACGQLRAETQPKAHAGAK